MKRSDFFRRATAVLLAALLAVGSLVASVGAAEPIAPYCDETYYATLDYYGGLMESSVVKSYETHGNAKITDYGVYSSVTNLNDNRAATVADGKVEFDLTGDVPTHFYFEGKTELHAADDRGIDERNCHALKVRHTLVDADGKLDGSHQ